MRVLWLGLALLFFGCAHTLTIKKDAPPERYAEAQNFLHQKPARLFTQTGTMLRATDWHIGPDSTTFRIDGATDRVVMLNERIRTITTQDSRRGTRTGALVGGITGGAIGLIIGSLLASIDSDPVCSPSEEEPNDNWSCGTGNDDESGALIVLSGVGIGACVGVVTGALIGSQAGTMRSVVFYPDPKDPRRWEYLPR